MSYYKFVHKFGKDSKYIKTDTILPKAEGVVFYTDELTGAFVPIDHDEYYKAIEISEEQYESDQRFNSPYSGFTEQDFLVHKKTNEIKCECGLEITNKGGRHSDWCIKWSPNE